MALGIRCFRLLHPAFSSYLADLSRPVSEVPMKTVRGRQRDHIQYSAHPAVPVRQFATKKAKGSLDHITVVTADGKLALNQIGQISMKSPQLILVNMASFPECTAAAIKAIRESGMNLNPEVEGTLIRVPIPKSAKWQTTRWRSWTGIWQQRPKNFLDESQQSQPSTSVCSCSGWQACAPTALTIHHAVGGKRVRPLP
ncbi:ribosome-recycling factor, mitochondrial isoform X4 [Rattus norvegicus]|uniref:ribosome-recycling factor, mitochondrial isoform X4 n=1 Tax=Rattus norvegicus TaxID=10116 RepID=UPI002FD80F31